MARNVIQSEFRTSKMTDGSHFVNKIQKKVVYRSEMAKNEIESDFQTSKMATGRHLVKKINRQPFCKQIKKKLCIDLKWPEM